MSHFKKLIYIIACFGFIQYGFSFNFQTDCEEKTFIVTAYYSPLSGQAFYYKDTYEAEKILNGEGLYGASGKGVFNGMLAAPSSYDFGGIIYFPSLGGAGEISDRGGAIVNAGERGHEYDRIDIRMGTGSLGLVKALTWGKKTITGYYCNAQTVKAKGIKPKLGFNLNSIPIMKYFFDSSLFIQELSYGRTDIRVYKLQEYLMKFGYLNKKTGYFGSETKEALCKYQIKRGLSTRRYCGTFGSNTRYHMKTEAKNKGFLPDFSETTTIDDLIYYAKNYNFKPVSTGNNTNTESTNTQVESVIQGPEKSIITHKHFTEPYNNGTKNSRIGDLQDLLRYLGFYTGEINNTYDKKTINAVHRFQIAAGILKADDTKSPSRGRLGPATRDALNTRWNTFQENKK